MSESWKDSLKDIQEELKHLVRKKSSVFSCVYIELPSSSLEEMGIDPDALNFWRDLEQKFAPSVYRAGHPLVNRFGPSSLCRHPRSGKLFSRRKETRRLLQWYCKSNVSAPRPRNLPAISKLPENFQFLTDAAKLIPLELFQNILGKDAIPGPKPLDNWMNLLFTVAWQSKEGTRLRTRDIVYWPHRDEDAREDYEYEYQDWISLDNANEIIIECRGKKSWDMTETGGLGRYLRKDLPNLFSIIKDVFQSSAYLIGFLVRQDFEKYTISRYDHKDSLKIIRYAAKYAYELPKATYEDIVKHVQLKYQEFRVDHFHTWTRGKYDYAKMLKEAVKKSQAEKILLLGGKSQTEKRAVKLSKADVKKINQNFCQKNDLKVEQLGDLLKAADEESRTLLPVEMALLEKYSEFKIEYSKRKTGEKPKKPTKKQ